MKIEYPGEMVADMLSLQRAYLEAEQKKRKDLGDIEEMYRDFIPEEIREAVSKNKSSFKNAKSIKTYLNRRWCEVLRGL